MIQLGCLSPSPGPTSTCVDSPSPLVKIGTQITVENRESISAWRLTIAKTRYCLGSPPGLHTRYNSPVLKFLAPGMAQSSIVWQAKTSSASALSLSAAALMRSRSRA